MKQKPTKKATKKAEPSAPKKKPVIKKKTQQEIEIDVYEMLRSYKPNYFKLSMNSFGFAFRELWFGIKGLFKK